MEPATYYALSLTIIVVALGVPYVVSRRRMSAARRGLGDDRGLLAEFDAARGGRRPVLIFLAAALIVLLVGGVVATFAPILIEPAVRDNWQFTPALLIFLGPPIVIGIAGVAILVAAAATGRARCRLLDQVAAKYPDRPELAEASRQLRGGRSRAGVAGTGAAAAAVCLALGLWWVALLFLVANTTMQCSRSSKCL